MGMEFEHESVLAELAAREPIFHRAEFGRTRAEFEAMMDPEFREVGASGREYTRDFVLGVLEERYSASFEDRWETTDFRCQSLAPDLYLLTYKLVQDGTRKSRRATIWRRTAGDWKIVYHQGTLIADGAV
jgi:hypothetical protein